MDLPISVPRPAATEHGFRASHFMPTNHEAADSCHTHSYPAVVTQSPWRKKLAWISQRVVGNRHQTVNPSSHGMSTLASEPTTQPSENSTYSLPSSTSSPHRARRRQEGGAWVREPARKRHASNRVRSSYQKAFQDRIVRKHTITSLVLGLLLVTLVTIYLAYTLTMNTLEGEEFHVLIIVFVILVAIFFCHSLARTCMLASRVARYGTTFHHRVPSVAGPRGYAQPAEPIHVVLARDEEVVGQDPGSSQVKLAAPPPAYGLWRNSVRIDPNLIRWQKVQAAKAAENSQAEYSQTVNSNRPPSYISENGVDYVIEAQPRSMVSHNSGSGMDIVR